MKLLMCVRTLVGLWALLPLGRACIALEIPYDPETMCSYSVSIDQAKEAARAWCGNGSLQLDLTGVDVTQGMSEDKASYVLKPPDRSQGFWVSCKSSQVVIWVDYVGDRAKQQRERDRMDESLWLPASELNDVARDFLSSRYPNFTTLNLQILDPDNPASSYFQRLQGGVWYDGNAAGCGTDAWTGQVIGYAAVFSPPPTVSLQYSVSASTAEQAAVDHVWTMDFPEYGEDGVEGEVHPRSVFLWKNRGVYVEEEPVGTQRLVWKVDAIANTEANYTREQFEAELHEEGSSAEPRVCVWVDANTGAVVTDSKDGGWTTHRPPSVAAPTLSVPAGTYTGAQSVAISCVDGATVRYTTDGSTPMPQSPLYSAPIAVDHSLTLKARAYKSGFRSSVLATAAYIIQ